VIDMTEKLVKSKTHYNNLYVAVEGAVGDWACYVGNINKGVEQVMRYGDKIGQDEARELFPEFAHLKWRY
jgi:hypothetical protein